MKKVNFSLVLLCLALIIVGCKKDDTEETPVTPITPEVAEYSFSAVIGGANVLFEVLSTSSYQVSHGTSKNIGDSATIIYSSAIGHTDISSYVEISKGTLVSYSSIASNSLFNSFFVPGTVAFSNDALHGIEIAWYDSATNKVWKTTGTSQTGSSFRFDTVSYFDFAGEHYAKYKATFNCKLMDEFGTVKTLTNGVMTCTFNNM